VVTVRPKLALLDDMAIFGKYFSDAGITINYSDKGNYVLDTLSRFGDLVAAGELISEKPTRAILERYAVKTSDEDGGAIYLEADQRVYLNFSALCRFIGDATKAADLLDHLVGRQVLQRGLILQCERCRLSSWYSLDQLTAEFRCNRCGLRQQFTRVHWKHPLEPDWYYKLAETVYQCFFHNSHVTIQTLYKLRAESKQAFHYAPELDLVGFPANSKSEIDLACVLDGQIVIGECKTEPLRPSHLKKYDDLAVRLNRRPDRLVFATTERTVGDDLKTRIRAVRGAEVLVFGDLFET
jgi:hypothetical protein